LARKILLADDSVTAQNMGRRILSDAGYEVITVNNGSAALKKIAELKPDLIILDVYMPGYGGLEVCQRLKESPETARIPVLLSVGKLEPFKVDEARRVRADAHIIKPFEASELLTALTKLEDKIVPQAETLKPGRFAKATASAEQLSTTSQSVGEDSGWKSRLTIPRGTPKPEAPEAAQSQPDSAGLRETAQREESKSAAIKSAEAAVAAALPQGITPEELAALAAAASSFAGSETSASPEKAEVSAGAKTDSPAEGKAQSTEVAEAVTLASAPAMEIEARMEVHQTSSQAAELQRATTDAEVLAALASLSPTQVEGAAPAGEFAGTNGDRAGAHREEQTAGSVAVSGGVRVAAAGASGPRWIAQPVAIAEGESALILEREMEKAYAAMAALEAEQASAPHAETNPPALSDAESVATSPEATSPAAEIASSPAAEPSPQAPPEETVRVPEVENSGTAVSSPEASAPQAAAASEASSSATTNANAVSATELPVANENAVYAAAASAGSGESSLQAANVSSPGAAQISAAPGESDGGKESELAAAWQNWRQIRESIMGSQPPKDVAQTAEATGFEPMRNEASVPPEPAAEASSDGAPSEAAAIANIVDSVLAELKPKLMEEISRKMKKDKKK